jgi:hypothetical protein
MDAVHQASDAGLSVAVAIKVIPPSSEGNWIAAAELERRFQACRRSSNDYTGAVTVFHG